MGKTVATGIVIFILCYLYFLGLLEIKSSEIDNYNEKVLETKLIIESLGSEV